MDGTHRAVKRPSSCWPVNQRNPDNANEMATANKIKISDFWNIELSSYMIKMGNEKVPHSIEPSAASKQPMIAKRAIECTVDSPANKFSGNWMNPPTTAIEMITVPISKAIPKTKSVRLMRCIKIRFILPIMSTRWAAFVWMLAAWASLFYWKY